MRYPAILAALAALLLASPATAEDFAPPEGCEIFLTVQNKSCSVSLLWRCDVAPEGDFWDASFGADGLQSIMSYTASYQWLDGVYAWDSSREVFTPPATDPIDLPTLQDVGIDTFDFTMRRSEPGKSYDMRVVGADMLTGSRVTIDGYEMETVRTRVEIIAEDGTVEYQARGTQYLSHAFELFFLGLETVIETDGSESEYDDSPVDIIEPGEPGFGATMPLYDCDQQKAGLELPGGLENAG